MTCSSNRSAIPNKVHQGLVLEEVLEDSVVSESPDLNSIGDLWWDFNKMLQHKNPRNLLYAAKERSTNY